MDATTMKEARKQVNDARKQGKVRTRSVPMVDG
jgi:hypothetical protein